MKERAALLQPVLFVFCIQVDLCNLTPDDLTIQDDHLFVHCEHHRGQNLAHRYQLQKQIQQWHRLNIGVGYPCSVGQPRLSGIGLTNGNMLWESPLELTSNWNDT